MRTNCTRQVCPNTPANQHNQHKDQLNRVVVDAIMCFFFKSSTPAAAAAAIV
jgi:hypothetical protein